ncbi:hypothetical protein [Aquimarina algicola]|uniref:Uncharacterized protein n=1 Tax=Aquimarina algicola TaxID=2589995 RepID=A0A504JFY7_9FLAO|nr:hypothetical protein [Aquimarina algicola]TPN85420.1 hypothetical protein FHK87_15510 [Aquimarina algicola]
MIRYKFNIEEAGLELPKNGVETYTLDSFYPVNYSKSITCNCKKEVIVEITSKEETPYMRYLHIYVSHSYFKFSEGSLAMRDILKKVASIYNRIRISISHQGEIKSIDNIEELQEKWKEIKSYIAERYKGEYVERFVQKTDETLADESKIIEEIASYTHFGLLLKPLYQQYSSEKSIILPQQLQTRYGKIVVDQKISLTSVEDTGQVKLNLSAQHPKKEEYINAEESFTFLQQKNSWIESAAISINENYGRKVYNSNFSIIKKS